ncbi:MAG: ABC transporter permease [Pirellulales bacterium]
MNLPSSNSKTTSAAATPAAKPHYSRGYWGDVWQRYRRKFFPMVALTYVVFMFIVGISAPFIVGTKPIVCRYKGKTYFPCLGYWNDRWEDAKLKKEFSREKDRYSAITRKDKEGWVVWPLVYQDPLRRLRNNEFEGIPENPLGKEGRPNKFNWFGTNLQGVDSFAHIVHGTQTALLVGFFSTGISAIIGLIIGALSGYLGGVVDNALSRLTEIFMCLPTLVMILGIIAVVEQPTIWHTMFVLGVTGWTSIARLTRGEFLKLREMEYVSAARALGVSRFRIMLRHILPNALAPVLVPISFGIASAILTENALSYLGLGSGPKMASWGNLLSAGKQSPENWWLILFPGLAIFLTVLAYNLIGEGLQEATDPRLREGTK